MPAPPPPAQAGRGSASNAPAASPQPSPAWGPPGYGAPPAFAETELPNQQPPPLAPPPYAPAPAYSSPPLHYPPGQPPNPQPNTAPPAAVHAPGQSPFNYGGAPAPLPPLPPAGPAYANAAPAPYQPPPPIHDAAAFAPTALPHDRGYPLPAPPPPVPLPAPDGQRSAARAPWSAAGRDPEQLEPQPARSLAGFLVSYEGNELGTFWPIYQGQSLLGRRGAANGLDIEIDHPTTSSRHAMLHASARPARLKIEDNGSTNGTFIGEQPLDRGKRYEVRDGDVVRFGGFATIVKLV